MPWRIRSISTTAGCDHQVVCHPFATPRSIPRHSGARQICIQFTTGWASSGRARLNPSGRQIQARSAGFRPNYGPVGPTAITDRGHGCMIGYACTIFSATANYINRCGSDITGNGPQVFFVTRYSVYLQRSSMSPYNPYKPEASSSV